MLRQILPKLLDGPHRPMAAASLAEANFVKPPGMSRRDLRGINPIDRTTRSAPVGGERRGHHTHWGNIPHENVAVCLAPATALEGHRLQVALPVSYSRRCQCRYYAAKLLLGSILGAVTPSLSASSASIGSCQSLVPTCQRYRLVYCGRPAMLPLTH
jgi:hypothetical protein